MSLTTRLTLFFVGVLGLVLVAMSLTLYFSARKYLYGELDERLRAAIGILLVSVEVKADTLEWEPEERTAIAHHFRAYWNRGVNWHA